MASLANLATRDNTYSDRLVTSTLYAMTPGRRQRVIDGIRALITTGVLHPGDQLPSITQLARLYAPVSQATVKQALAELRATGWTRGEPGVGVFVADQPPLRPND